MSAKKEKRNEAVKITHMPEVDELLAQAGSGDFAPLEFASTQESGAPARGKIGKKRKKKGARGVLIALGCLLAALVGGAVAVAEPWTSAVPDQYTEPAVRELPRQTLAVNESYTFEFPLGENERVYEIAVQDPDILALSEDESAVTAKGEYFSTTVSITTGEIAVPKQEYPHRVELFGRDFSAQYNALRSFLRDLIGVEKEQPPRQETRVLARYSQTFTVSGLGGMAAEPPMEIAAYLQNGVTLELAVQQGEEVQLASFNESTAAVRLDRVENGTAYLTVKGAADTKTKVRATFGFWKAVDPEIYAAYRQSLPATDGQGVPLGAEQRENQIFVPQRSTTFTVAVTDLAKPVVSTDLAQETERVLPEPGQQEAEARALLELVNGLRTANGLPALHWSDELAAGAQTRAQELAAQYTHTRPNGTDGKTAANGAAAESISAGYLTAQAVFDSWNGCDNLLAGMLAADRTAFGAAFYRVEDGAYNNYWCALYG